MDRIDGIDLQKLTEEAAGKAAKTMSRQLEAYIQGLVIKRHNLQLKATRLTDEASQALKAGEEISSQLDRMGQNDWSDINISEFKEQQGKGKE